MLAGVPPDYVDIDNDVEFLSVMAGLDNCDDHYDVNQFDEGFLIVKGKEVMPDDEEQSANVNKSQPLNSKVDISKPSETDLSTNTDSSSNPEDLPEQWQFAYM